MDQQEMGRLLRIFPEMMKTLRCGFVPEGVNRTEFRTLMEMRSHPDRTMSHYVRAVGIENGSFTYLADRLEKKGLILREKAADKRKTVLKLTEEGRRAGEALCAQFDAHAAEKLSCLTEDERGELEQAICILEHIHKKLETHHG